MLGIREPELYGTGDYSALLKYVKQSAKALGLSVRFFQSNEEGKIVTAIQKAYKKCDGIVINAGAYTHTSLAMADAISAVKVPVVEVHISNVFRREEFRHHSYLSPVCAGTIVGFGLKSYDLALEAFL